MFWPLQVARDGCIMEPICTTCKPSPRSERIKTSTRARTSERTSANSTIEDRCVVTIVCLNSAKGRALPPPPRLTIINQDMQAWFKMRVLFPLWVFLALAGFRGFCLFGHAVITLDQDPDEACARVILNFPNEVLECLEFTPSNIVIERGIRNKV